MSKTIQKIKKDNKPYITSTIDSKDSTANTTFTNCYNDGSSHRTYIVKKRLFDENGALWGVIAESNGKLYRIDTEKLLSMIAVEKIPFVVDWTGKDKPATLTVVHKRMPDGSIYYFKTLGDKYMKNNFSKVPTAKSQSSSFRKLERVK